MASLDDLDLIKKSREAANIIIEKNISNPEIENKLKQFQNIIHME